MLLKQRSTETVDLRPLESQRCSECGAEMSASILPRYTNDALFGIDGVVILHSVKEWKCTQCDEVDIEIRNLDGLIAAIACVRSLLTEKLSGKEIRFLRNALDMTGRQLAEHLDVREETVSRWETGRDVIAPSNEKVLRLFAIGHLRDKAPAIVFGNEQIKELASMRLQPTLGSGSVVMCFELVRIIRGDKRIAWDTAA